MSPNSYSDRCLNSTSSARTEFSGGTAGPTLVLACEEPELYQHPPQIRHLAFVFDDLVRKDTQALVCTHSPRFVRGEQFEEVRFVTKSRENGEAIVRFLDLDSLAESMANAGGNKPPKAAGTVLKVSQALQPVINEMFFTRMLVLVEGLEDASYISTCLVLADLWREFRRIGGHIVSSQGKNSMIVPLAIARGLKMPTFFIFGADTDKCADPGKKVQHERDNRTLLNLCGLTAAPSIPDEPVWTDRFVMWKEDIGAVLAEGVGKAQWDALRHAVKVTHGLVDMADVYKCSGYIQQLLSELWDQGKKCPTLERLCKAVIAFAQIQNERVQTGA